MTSSLLNVQNTLQSCAIHAQFSQIFIGRSLNMMAEVEDRRKRGKQKQQIAIILNDTRIFFLKSAAYPTASKVANEANIELC